VTDIAVHRTDPDRVAVCYGGTSAGPGPASVFFSVDGGTTWTDISNGLPNISANAVALDPNDDDTIYVGTDVGVYRTTDLGASWTAFDNGIPNVVISDLHVDREDNALYAATFGRGMYKLNIAPGVMEPVVDLYLRDSLLDVGERFPSPSGEPNPNDVSDDVFWWESPDIKVEVPPYYTADAVFDGVEFDEDVVHDDPQRTKVNRFYLQVHNRGWQATAGVRVRAFLADAHAGLPPLPNALTPPNFDLTSTVDWQPIGSAQTIPLLEPNRPVIVSWDWTVPAGANTHSCLLAVVSSPDDPIASTATDIGTLVLSEKRVCLKNLHVVNGTSPGPSPSLVTLKFHNALDREDRIDIVVRPTGMSQGTLGLLLEPVDFADRERALVGADLCPLYQGEEIGRWYGVEREKDEILRRLDLSQVYELDPVKTSELRGIRLGPRQTLQAAIACKGARNPAYGRNQRFSVLQRQGGHIVGGSTFELRPRRARGLLPVSRIRIILEKVRMRKNHEFWLKGKGGYRFVTCVVFNGDPNRRHCVQVPETGGIEIGHRDRDREHTLNLCVFDGYVAEQDSMAVSLRAIENELLGSGDKLTMYRRDFAFPPETWVGAYAPDDEGGADPEKLKDWSVWYRIESVRLPR
jgi:hypothetical protein